jgi:hypothetical protein
MMDLASSTNKELWDMLEEIKCELEARGLLDRRKNLG